MARCCAHFDMDGALLRALAVAFNEGEARGRWMFSDAVASADVTIGCLSAFVRLRFGQAFSAGWCSRLEAVVSRSEAPDLFSPCAAARAR
jgi:hypothetical protein